MKPPAPAVLRKGAVVRVAGPGPEAVPISPKYALVFIDLQYDDGHVERWLGAGSLHDDPSQPFPYDSLVQWGDEVVEEQSMLGDLGRAFSGVDRAAVASAPVEIVVEWNAELPQFP